MSRCVRWAIAACVTLAGHILAPTATAQTAVVTGRVVDSAGTPVVSATVRVAGTLLRARTDTLGVFQIRAPTGTVVIEVLRIGFQLTRQELPNDPPGSSRIHTIVAARSAAALGGVLIPGERRVSLGQTISRTTARNAPPLGEPDIIRALPFLPGVTQPNDNLPRVHLAGAASDEASLTIDGHPLQFPTHLSGIVGAFNVAALDRAELMMHHVPATTDARLGGHLALETREPAARTEGEIVASLLAASATLSTPLAPLDGDVLVSVRYTYLSSLAERVIGTQLASEYPWPAYGDALLRFGVRPAPGWRLEALGYFSHDWTDVSNRAGALGRSVGEGTGGIRLERERAGSRVMARISQDVATVLEGSESGLAAEEMRVRQRWSSAEVSVVSQRSPTFTSTFEVALDERVNLARWSEPFLDGSDPRLPRRLNSEDRQLLVAVAAEGRVARSQSSNSTFGLRVSSAGARTYLAPRLSAGWLLLPTTRLELALDRRYQFDAQVGDPTDGRLPPPTFLLRRPRRMDGIAATLEWSPSLRGGGSVVLSATPFARSYVARTLPVAAASDSVPATDVTFSRFNAASFGVGAGLTYGSAHGASLQLAYAFTRSLDRGASGWSPADWETPHASSVLLTIPLGRAWKFTTAGVFASGRPVTPIIGQVLIPVPDAPGVFSNRFVYGERNSAGMPATGRLDVAVRRHWRRRGRDFTLSCQGVNVLRRENALEYDWYRYVEEARATGVHYPSRSGLPFVPSLGLEVRW